MVVSSFCNGMDDPLISFAMSFFGRWGGVGRGEAGVDMEMGVF